MNALIIFLVASILCGVNIYRILVVWKRRRHILRWNISNGLDTPVVVELAEEDLEEEGYIRAIINNRPCTVYLCSFSTRRYSGPAHSHHPEEQYLYMLCKTGSEGMLCLHGTIWHNGKPLRISKAMVWKQSVNAMAPVPV